jgi:hypothetical protein
MSFKVLASAILILLNQGPLMPQKTRIKVAEYNYTFIPQRQQCRDTFFAKIEGNRFLKIYLFSCKGSMNLECYNKDSVIIEKGPYESSLDLLKSYYYANDVTEHRAKIKVASYYQPLRNGTWYFYNEKGNLTLQKNYKDGIVVDSLKVQ